MLDALEQALYARQPLAQGSSVTHTNEPSEFPGRFRASLEGERVKKGDCDKSALILSVRPRWTALIFGGQKTVELRRRFPLDLDSGTTAVVYASAPLSAIVGTVAIDRVLCQEPARLWDAVGHLAAVGAEEYHAYFAGISSATALFLRAPQAAFKPLPLDRLRVELNFNPPVSWRWIKSSEHWLLEEF